MPDLFWDELDLARTKHGLIVIVNSPDSAGQEADEEGNGDHGQDAPDARLGEAIGESLEGVAARHGDEQGDDQQDGGDDHQHHIDLGVDIGGIGPHGFEFTCHIDSSFLLKGHPFMIY